MFLLWLQRKILSLRNMKNVLMNIKSYWKILHRLKRVKIFLFQILRSRCNDLIEKFKTIKYLGILEEQARAMAINDLSKFISEAKDIQPKD